ncbi:MAG: polyphenol oxidase family protein [Synergistaceae bacterium]|nr:polyphenol oxidase family protein [Synergistaceae bacterium]
MRGFEILSSPRGRLLAYLGPKGETMAHLSLAERGRRLAVIAGDLADHSRLSFLPPRLVWPEQIHGTAILEGEKAPIFPVRPKADGLFFQGSGKSGRLRFADCAPLLLAGRNPFHWALGLHCGFKGIVSGIVERGLALLQSKGISLDDTLRCWIGPAIGPCCFDRNLDDPWTQKGLLLFKDYKQGPADGLVRFDLIGDLKARLLDAGLSEDKIFCLPHCTCCHPDLFYSYRGGDRQARMSLFFSDSGSPLLLENGENK